MSKQKPITYMVLVLDQSGSMSSIRDTAVRFYNESVQQTKLSAKDQDIRVGVITFSGNVFEHLWNVPASDLQESTTEGYVCDGGTALNDALGYTILKLKETASQDDPNVAFLVQVVTDGEENQSTRFKKETVFNDGRWVEKNPLKKLIEEVQSTGKWTFTFMGCSGDYLQKLAQDTAVPLANMAAWNPQNTASPTLNRAGQAHYFTARSSSPSGRMARSFYDYDGVQKTAEGLADGSWLDEETGGSLVAAASAAAGIDSTALEAVKEVCQENVFGHAKPAVWKTEDK
ncbi:MAG: VWA domain-containing protein [Patescibacteria group bacterium]|nr:VWA domain-containing protein [Patescibacteria group bacterium]